MATTILCKSNSMKLIHIVQKKEIINEHKHKDRQNEDTKILLITLWVLYSLNFMYADTLSNYWSLGFWKG